MKAFKNMCGALTVCEMKKPRYRILYWTMFAILLIFAVGICLFPVVWILLAGFKDANEIYAIPATLFPKHFHISKLGEVWTKLHIYEYYFNTTYMSLVSVVFTLVVSGLAGYVLAKVRPAGTRFINTVVFWLMLVPTTMSTVPLYMTFKDFPIFHFSMLNTYWPIWLMNAAVPFNIILFKNYFAGIPNAIIEAGKIDGLGEVGIFRWIMVPMGQPIFLVVGLFTFMGAFGNFFWPYILINDESKTVLAVQLYKLKSSTYTLDYQLLAILFSVLPLLVLYAIFQDKIISGMNLGGVKG